MKRVQVFNDTEVGNTLVYSWRSYIAFFLIFFCAIWNSFLVFWYSISFSKDVPLVFVLFPLIHVAVGIGLSYFTLCLLVNKTKVFKNKGRLVIKHGPLPVFSNKEIDLSAINYVQVHRKVYRSSKGRSNVQYGIEANIGAGNDIKLISPYLLQDGGIANKIKDFINEQLTSKSSSQRRSRTPDITPLSPKTFSVNGVSLKNVELLRNYKVEFSELSWEGRDKKDEIGFLGQLENDELSEAYFYLNRNNASVWQEKRLTKSQALSLEFNKGMSETASFPDSCTFEGVRYHLEDSLDGTLFVEGQFMDHIKQWSYTSSSNKKIRIVQYRNKEGLDLFQGQQVSLENLSKIG